VLSRIPDPSKVNFSVCALFDKLKTLVINNKENQGIAISFSCENQNLEISADEQMITQVMLNLIKNAVQALEGIKDSSITVQAMQSSTSNVQISVTDNGPGIPAESADEIFLPFFTTRRKGTGVGLSYSRQVMSMNGGSIEVNSNPGRTEFKLLF
jgi:signal transduction histidine kinase